MKIHVLSGFLGSGKTTAIEQACRQLVSKNIGAGVITNDQGIKLVDAQYFKSRNITTRQVGNGCFCCNYDELEAQIQSLADVDGPELIFAESVGSCTDIVATVIRPLLKYHAGVEVRFSTFADVRLLHLLLSGKPTSFDEQVRYIYYKQLEEAGLIVVSKVDLIDHSSLEEVKQMVRERYAGKPVLYQNSLDTAGITRWLQVADQYPAGYGLPSSEIDYDIYAGGEARLAWLDQELEIYSAAMRARQDAVELMNRIYQKITERRWPIGHLKFSVDGATKLSFTAGMEDGIKAELAQKPAVSCAVLINARIQTDPESLSQLVSAAVEEVEAESGCRITAVTKSSFQPGYPRPTHRITD